MSDLISTHARRHIFGYRMMVWAIVAIGVLSFVVWAHHMYVSGMNPYFGFFFATTTLIIAIPTALKVYNWVLTLWRGDIHLTVPMLFAIGFVFTFINGGLTGLFLGNVTVDVPLSDTLLRRRALPHGDGRVAGAGRVRRDLPLVPEDDRAHDRTRRSARLHFWCTLFGTYAIFLPMHYLGILGVPRRYFALGDTYFIPDSVQSMNAGITHRGAVRGGRAVDLPLQPDLEPEARQAGGRQSVARDDARMADARHAAEARQLGTANCRSCTAGPTNTARRAPKEDFVPQNQPPDGHTPVTHGHHRVNLVVAFAGIVAGILVWWLAVRRLTTRSWEAQGTYDGRDSADLMGIPPAARGAVDLPGGGHLVLRAVHRGLLHSHEPAAAAGRGAQGLAPGRRAVDPLGQHGAAAREQPGDAVRARRDRPRADSRARASACWRAAPSRSPSSPGSCSPGASCRRPATTRPRNPANAFFYVLTGLHGLHLLGGLVVLGRTGARMSRPGASPDAVRLGIELCTVYWHYLLVVWLVLFGLLLIT